MQFRRVILLFMLCVCVYGVHAENDELCMDGTLLFREDFGGNDVNDPAVARTPVSGMSSEYTQIYKLQTSDAGTGMGAGSYLVSKRGYRNSSDPSYSVWHIMDDHTFPGDTTRGYLLEIDGYGSGNDVFFSTTINGLLAGSRITFSAYVANVTTAGQYEGWKDNRSYVFPNLSFVITDVSTGAEIARHETGGINHDYENYPKSWRESANWQLVGLNFTVPAGVSEVRLSICNNASGSSTGNDFALDDIEIRQCVPEEPELCMDGTLLFREDFGGNDPNDPRIGQDPVPGMSYTQLLTDRFGVMGGGRYLLTKQGYCNGDTSTAVGPQYRFSQWHLQDDHTYPNDVTRGYLLEIDGRGDNAVFYTKTIDGLCAGSRMTFSAYVANVVTWGHYVNRKDFVYPRLKFVLINPENDEELATYDTGDIPFDSAFIGESYAFRSSSKWNLVGMNFTVPEGISSVKLTIHNNVIGSTGNDFAMDDIEIRLCMPTPEIVSEREACLDSVYRFEVDFANDGTLVEPLEYKWWFSADSVTWVEKPGFIGKNPTLETVQKADSGWYKVAVSSAGNIESVNCRAISEPFLLQPVRCKAPAVYLICDTTACHEDKIVYHGHTFVAPSVYKDTVFVPDGRDTIYNVTVTDKRSFREMSITITVGNPPPHPWENVTESGVYYDTLVNAAGCDSIVSCSIYFKERCKEYLEERHMVYEGETYVWHGLSLSGEGDYRDTLWHTMPEACDTVCVLHLEELSVEQLTLESGCAEGEQIVLDLQLSRPVDSVRFSFSKEAKAAGLRDSIVYIHAKEATLFIPRRGVHPGNFSCEVALVHNGEVLYRNTFVFTLLYPASVLEQAWNDVVAVLTHDYNGGYDFVAFQWYENGVPLTGENRSYLYRPLVMGGEYSALLTEADGTRSMTCPLVVKRQEDISLYPTVVGPHQVIHCYVTQEAELWLYDALGRVVGHYRLSDGETQIASPGTTGVYVACIITSADNKPHPYKLLVR